MLSAPIPADEAARLDALRALRILDTPAEERFDRIARLVAELLDVPIALVSLVDSDRQWFKSHIGLASTETPREQSFCAHAVAARAPLEVSDARVDERFHDNPLVTGAPSIRFYAGHPLMGPGGQPVGTLCAIDRRPRTLDARQRRILAELAAIAERELNLAELGTLQDRVIASQAEVERLLLCILPRSVALQLRAGAPVEAEHFEDATVLFADVVGFSRAAAGRAPREVAAWLGELYSLFDALAEGHGVERVKTVGDGYMAACGAPTRCPDHVRRAVEMALEMQAQAGRRRALDGSPLQLRIGVHRGSVAGGVVGTTRFAYDLWGDAVNVASRLESCAEPGRVQVSDAVRRGLETLFRFEPRGTVALKGVGPVDAYIVAGRVSQAAVSAAGSPGCPPARG